jgi:glycogen operon protein
VLSTDPAHPVDTKVAAGDTLVVAARALVLLQEA